MIYCIDTNALIHSWQFWYARQTHPTLWNAVERLGASGRLKMPEQVLDELGEKEDDLYTWCRNREEALVAEATNETEEAYRTLVNRYPEMTGTLGVGADYADLYVVAVAAVNDATVVTNEDRGFERHPTMRRQRSRSNYEITNVCHDESIPFIRAYGLVRREGWVFKH
jgi:predicted nucleic acid-binding protein